MITTNTGAKKIEGTDNWREIFDAHNDSVDAQDKLAPDMAPIVNGNKCVSGASAGDYVLVRNSSITGITDGAYIAAQAIPANTAIDSTYLTAISGGALNSLNSKIGLKAVWVQKTYSISSGVIFTPVSDIPKNSHPIFQQSYSSTSMKWLFVTQDNVTENISYNVYVRDGTGAIPSEGTTIKVDVVYFI